MGHGSFRCRRYLITAVALFATICATGFADAADDALLSVAQDGRRADDVAEVLGDNLDLVMGMAEYPYNPERSLAVVPLSAHYLSNPADDEHRFNRAIWHQEFRKRRSFALR